MFRCGREKRESSLSRGETNWSFSHVAKSERRVRLAKSGQFVVREKILNSSRRLHKRCQDLRARQVDAEVEIT